MGFLKCPFCGQEIDSEAKKCFFCGNELNSSLVNSNSLQVSGRQFTTNAGHSISIVKILLFIFLCAIVLSLVIFLIRHFH